MKHLRLSLLLLLAMMQTFSQNSLQHSTDSATFFLHKFQQNIGKEKYIVEKTDSGYTYTIDFKFVDRGAAVPVKSVLRVNQNLDPMSLYVKGKNSRFSTVSDSITIQNNVFRSKVDDSLYSQPVDANSFPVVGYSPGTVQMVLVQFWKTHHKPTSIKTIPFGSVQIKLDGMDTFSFNNSRLELERYIIGGLIWGNEFLWTDKNGQLICLITNDAEGDKLEMMLEPYESLLPGFISRSAKYGMESFAQFSIHDAKHPKTIVIKGGNIVDVVNGKHIENGVVLIENGKIKDVGPSSMIKYPSSAMIIDAKGKTVLPGLWDMHSHFEQVEWGPAYLAAGVTSVRDVGNEFEFINAVQKSIDNGAGIGPHILKAGIIDGSGSFALGIIQATTEEQAVQAVRRYKDNGFVQIKIYSSVKPEIVKAICTEAHRLGLTVTGHIPQGMNLRQGVELGMDMVNHIDYVTGLMKKIPGTFNTNFSDSTNLANLEFLRSHNLVVDPTLGIMEFIYRSTADPLINIEPAFATIPLPLQVLFKNMGMSPNQSKRYQVIFEDEKKMVAELHKRGFQIVTGTDMMIPGYSLDREIELYVDCGFTPLEAIQSSTIVSARAMRVENISGSIEKGKRADIIIVNGNPLEKIRDIRNVETVIKDGQIYDPVQLHQLVGFMK